MFKDAKTKMVVVGFFLSLIVLWVGGFINNFLDMGHTNHTTIKIALVIICLVVYLFFMIPLYRDYRWEKERGKEVKENITKKIQRKENEEEDKIDPRNASFRGVKNLLEGYIRSTNK